VNAAASGDTIQVDAGNYKENVTIPAPKSGLTLDGAQAGINPVPGRSGPESVLNGDITISASDVTFDGFTVMADAQWAIEIGGPSVPSQPAINCLIQNNIVNNPAYGIQVGGEGGPGTLQVPLYCMVRNNALTGIGNVILFNTADNTVQGNLFKPPAPNNDICIEIYYSDSNLVQYNGIVDSQWYAIRLRGSHVNTVQNNYGSGDGQPYIDQEEGSSGNTVQSNNFQATTLFVDPSGRTPTGMSAFPTIQAAVNAAAVGDTIQVDPGTYNESVSIPGSHSAITVKGAKSGINPSPGRPGPESIINGQVTITGACVTLDGFTVSVNAQWAIEVGGATAPSIPASSCTIENTIVNSSTYGIQVGAEGGPSTQQVPLYALVRNNLLQTGNSDIALFNTANNTVTGNTIPMTPSQFGSGIDVYYSDNDFITANTIKVHPGFLW
jgi:hypothetical protein